MIKKDRQLDAPYLIPTILSGGVGSRLWPASRSLYPKPFIKLQDGQSLLQKSFLRALSLPNIDEVLSVTSQQLFFYIQDTYRELSHNELTLSYLLEPFSRNTAAAIAAAALYIEEKYGGDVILLILPADHLVRNQSAFNAAVMDAVAWARKGKLVTFGVAPTSPRTGYGYIQASGNKVVRFIEKPTKAAAATYIDSGDFFWNSGMFCFSAASILAEMKLHCPKIIAAVADCLAQATILGSNNCGQATVLDPALFQQVEAVSIDYVVLEHSEKVAVIPCDIGWSDMGSWLDLGGLPTADENDNCIKGDVILEDAQGCLIQSNSRLVAGLGIKDLIIADYADALLVAHKDKAQDVKKIFQRLTTKGCEQGKICSTVDRPWGSYTVLEKGAGFKVKRIEMKPGAKLSLQVHQHRSEHWIVVNGVAKVTNGDHHSLLKPSETVFIPAGNKHRLGNPGNEVLIVIETQCGDYLEEDDIIRIQDQYGRID